MSYLVRVYGPTLNQSLSHYLLASLTNVRNILRTPNYRPLSLMRALWGRMKCLHG